MINFPIDYFIYIYFSSLATIQVAATKSNLTNFLIIKNKFVTFIAALIIFISSTIFFLYSDNRIINDFEGGLDANQQFLLFACACVTSFITTSMVTSLYRKSDTIPSNRTSLNRIEALSDYNFIQLQLLKWNYYKKLT
tara:strand:+ start:3313 stop:3726 length:414 start_codon:yes stop_codon:yes gene_type:complete